MPKRRGRIEAYTHKHGRKRDMQEIRRKALSGQTANLLATALAQKLVYENILPKHFVHPTFPCVLRAFSKGLSVRELRTQSRKEQAQRELGWELAACRGILI